MQKQEAPILTSAVGSTVRVTSVNIGIPSRQNRMFLTGLDLKLVVVTEGETSS